MNADLLFYLLVFPGLLFTAILGLTVGWVDRKVSARFQFRVGPPFFQNFNDIIKLFGKETIIPRQGVSSLFVISPFAAFGIIVVTSAIVGAALFLNKTIAGDLIVIMYLLMTVSVMVILGGSSSGNIYSSIGSGREMLMLLADEFAFILVMLVPIVKSGYQLSLEQIILYQNQEGVFIASLSGILGFIAGILCIQAKMTMPPFHIPEAETEIIDGPYMEYSGPLLGFWKLNHFMMYVLFPFLLIGLFWGGFNFSGMNILWSILKYLLIIVLMIIMKNTNPRIRIDTALSFFWKYVVPVMAAALILAVFGY